MNEHTQRINEIMKNKMMNATQFSEAIGIQRAAMSHITQGRNNPSAVVLTKILEQFTDIDPGWLMTGKGTMKIKTENYNNDLFEESHFQTEQSDTKQSVQTINPQTILLTENTKTETPTSLNNEVGGNSSERMGNIIEKEVIIYKEKPIKTIDKLLIFYSDRTFDTFIPENIDS